MMERNVYYGALLHHFVAAHYANKIVLPLFANYFYYASTKCPDKRESNCLQGKVGFARKRTLSARKTVAF